MLFFMNSRNWVIAFDRSRCFRLIWVASLLYLVVTSGCATIEADRYREGPYIVSTYPAPGDFNIPRYTDISIRFSEAMDPSTDTGFEVLSKGIRVEGTKRWLDANTVLVFRPDKPLEGNSMYEGIIREGKSKDGKALGDVPFIWMFTAGN